MNPQTFPAVGSFPIQSEGQVQKRQPPQGAPKLSAVHGSAI